MNRLHSTVTASTAPRRWPLFLVGFLLFVVGPALYFVQLRTRHLWMPWYVPALATAGVLFMILSVLQRRGVLRSVGLVLFALLCGLEWYFALVASRSPLYTGPAQVGRKVSAFAATLADGTPFTNKDLENGSRTVLVFFRGRW